MRPAQLTKVITEMYKIKRPLCIEGQPGGGKTTLVADAAKLLNIGYIEKNLPTMLVEDFGMPWPIAEDSTFSYKIPSWYPAEFRTDIPDEGILCIDDRNQGGPDLQKVLANLQQARNLHGVPLKKGWMVISTGNRQSDRAGANRVLSHLRNRETVIEFETHLDDWCEWAIENDVRSELLAFIRFRPGLLHDFDPQRDINPTPRSWVEGVSDVLGTVSPEAEFECFKGAIGEGAAAEFTGFLKIFRKLPDPASIFLNPRTAEVPKDPATLYALSGALAQRASSSNFDALMQYLERVPKEFSVLTVSYAGKRDTSLYSTAAFIRWSVENKDVLFASDDK